MGHVTDRHVVRLAVYLVLRKDDQVLMLRRSGTGYMDGKLGLPSGHVEDNEPSLQAIVREAKEEVGVTVAPADLKLVHTLHRRAEEGGFEYIDLYFEALKWQGEPQNMEPHKCSEVLWASLTDLPPDTIGPVRQALEGIVAGRGHGDVGFD